MNQMEIFNNPEFGSIRTFEQDGTVLFMRKGYCESTTADTKRTTLMPSQPICKGVCVSTDLPSNGRHSANEIYSRRRCVPPDRSQQAALCGTV